MDTLVGYTRPRIIKIIIIKIRKRGLGIRYSVLGGMDQKQCANTSDERFLLDPERDVEDGIPLLAQSN